MGKMIQRELWKGLKFDNATKCYTHKPESVLENETPKILNVFFKKKIDHRLEDSI